MLLLEHARGGWMNVYYGNLELIDDAKANLRIVLRQLVAGKPLRSAAGSPPNGRTLGNLLKIEASQNHRSRPVACQYDKAIWSGLFWAVGEVRHRDLDPGLPITIRCSSLEKQPVELHLEFYAVSYD